MSPDNSSPNNTEHDKHDLRSRAEAHLARLQQSPLDHDLSDDRVRHELSVHQIELELQNEELKRAHDELEQARNYLLGLFDQSPMAYVTLDENHRVREANAAALELFRFPNDLPGVDMDVFIAQRHLAVLRTTIGRALRSGERQSCELQYAPFQERTLRWMRFHCAPLRQSGNYSDVIVLCSMEDVSASKHFEQNLVMAKNAVETEVERRTRELQQVVEQLQGEVEERRRAENAWRSSEERYRRLVDQLPALVYTADLSEERRFRFISRQAESMLGYTAAELLDIPGSWLSRVHKDDVTRLREAMQRCSREQVPLNEEYRFICKNDSEIWLQDQATLVHLPATLDDSNNGQQDDGLPYLQGLIFDITEAKRTDQELRDAKVRAELASRSKSEFLANMSHEIRTPLNGMLGMLQLMGLSPLDEEQEKFVKLAIESGHSLLRVINDILDFSKIEAGKLEISAAPFSVRELLQGVVQVFQMQAESKNLQLYTSVAPLIPKVLMGDDARLRQILFNLVGNAVKFTEKGDVSVIVDLAPQQEHGSEEVALEFIVRDTGVGIPQDFMDHIFEPFTQIDSTFTRKHQGTGLGLGIVRRLVDLMRGEISISSEPGAGTELRLSLPFTPIQGQEPDILHHTKNVVRQEALQVLLAEDNVVNMTAARRMLESLGHSVHCAENGNEALKALAENTFDCLLLDVQMPELDGMEVTRAIREAPPEGVDSSIYIIAMTAHAMSGDKERFLKAGMDDYVAKPVDLRQLEEVLQRAMQHMAS